VIKERLGHRIDGWIHTVFPFLFWHPINPDWLTIFGMLIAGSAGLAFAHGSFRLAGCLLIVGGFFDLVDGAVARHFEVSTRFGAFLDSTLDRVVDILVMAGLLVYFASAPVLRAGSFTLGKVNGLDPNGLEIVLCTVILVASVVTSYAKARAELVLPRMPGGLLERGERIGLLAVGAIFGILGPVLWILATGTVITVGQHFLYAHREMTRLDQSEPSAGRGPSDHIG
jgi:phosphatidylglycerophosphate synthase